MSEPSAQDIERHRLGLLLAAHDHRGVKIPEYMHAGLVRYLVDRIPPGGFMLSVLGGDLFGAAERADVENTFALASWASFLASHVDRRAYGSPGAVANWLGKPTTAGLERRPLTSDP